MKWRGLMAVVAVVLLSVLTAHAQNTRGGVDFGEPQWDPHYTSVTDGDSIKIGWLGPRSWIRVYSWSEDIYVLTNSFNFRGTPGGEIDRADTLRIPAGIPWAFTPRCDSLKIGVYDGSGTTAVQVESQPDRAN